VADGNATLNVAVGITGTGITGKREGRGGIGMMGGLGIGIGSPICWEMLRLDRSTKLDGTYPSSMNRDNSSRRANGD
jgi:hypothetical protein